MIRTFADTPREDVQATVALDGLGEHIAFRLQATMVSQPEDNQAWRPDGSYVAASLGKLGVGSRAEAIVQAVRRVLVIL